MLLYTVESDIGTFTSCQYVAPVKIKTSSHRRELGLGPRSFAHVQSKLILDVISQSNGNHAR